MPVLYYGDIVVFLGTSDADEIYDKYMRAEIGKVPYFVDNINDATQFIIRSAADEGFGTITMFPFGKVTGNKHQEVELLYAEDGKTRLRSGAKISCAGAANKETVMLTDSGSKRFVFRDAGYNPTASEEPARDLYPVYLTEPGKNSGVKVLRQCGITNMVAFTDTEQDGQRIPLFVQIIKRGPGGQQYNIRPFLITLIAVACALAAFVFWSVAYRLARGERGKYTKKTRQVEEEKNLTDVERNTENLEALAEALL